MKMKNKSQKSPEEKYKPPTELFHHGGAKRGTKGERAVRENACAFSTAGLDRMVKIVWNSM